MATLTFPDNINSTAHSNFMQIKMTSNSQSLNFAGGSTDFITIFIPGGQYPLSYQQQHIYTDVKLARLVPGGDIATAPNLINYGMQKLFGKAINPGVDILYQSTPLRQFQFSFLLAPTNPNEANSMQQIVKMLRFHAAPQIGNNRYMLLVPSLFDINFYYTPTGQAPVINDKIPKISQCVCERIDVDFPAPGSEFSTFYTGHPVTCMINILLREMEIIDKGKVLAGF